MAWSRTRLAPMTSAMVFAVMSSWVVDTAAHDHAVAGGRVARSAAPGDAAAVVATAWWKCETTPLAASRSPSQAELASVSG